MASVNGVSGSNLSSIYGNRNVISGLASGLDTEGLITNSVSGYKLKINSLLQQQTKTTWKQDAYRSVSDLLVQLSQKYTSYTSSTNLLSSSFFNNATVTTSNGTNASSVSATGKTSSDIAINGVAQLATASRYVVDGGTGVLSASATDANGNRNIAAANEITFVDHAAVSNISGDLTIKYGNNDITLTFGSDEIYQTKGEFLKAIQDKLEGQTITFSTGTSGEASDYIDVKLDGEKITFSDKKAAGNTVYLSGASGKFSTMFGGSDFTADNAITSLDLSGKELAGSTTVMEKISGQAMTFNLDGNTKKINLPTAAELQAYIDDKGSGMTQEAAFTALLQEKLDKAYGNGKIAVTNGATENGKLKLGFSISGSSNLSVSSTANTSLGLSATESTSLNTSKTLGELLGDNLGGLSGGTVLKGTGTITKQSDGTYKDSLGNLVNEDGERLGKDNNPLLSYDLEINGAKIGSYTRDTAMETILLDINKNTEAGVNVSYSSTTNQFVFTARETGAGQDIDIGEGLGEAIFGTFNSSNYKQGEDAVVNMTVNGTNLTVTRNSNNFSVDGLSVTLNSTFNSTDGEFDFANPDGTINTNAIQNAVTFTTKSDADKIVDAVKSMVTDVNTILTSLREAYATVPNTKSNNSKYEPLTEDDMEGMTETAIKNYEEKAKKGILFGDRDLSALYDKLVSAFSGGSDGSFLRSIGINTTYSNGLTQIEVDETKLREALNSNPDAVRDAFTKVKGEGSSTDGLMQNVKGILNTYASVDGATKGILINKAGSKYSALSLLKNNLKDQIDEYDKQILSMQTKMATKIDYYTRQYTQLESLIAQMNSQSDSLANMMGGYA